MDEPRESLTPEQEYFARVMFQNRILRSDGQNFEDIFVDVMTRLDPRFRPVKAQGPHGDEGNDGFIPEEGRYFQVYAPEDPKDKASSAAKKARRDFAKLKKNWESVADVIDYRFVFNDKFKGSYPVIEHELNALKEGNSLKNSKAFLAKDLEREFTKLSPSDMQAVLRSVIPRPQYIDDIDYAALTEVLQHLINNQLSLPAEGLPAVPDYDEKIEFNEIDTAASLLKVGNFQNGAVEKFFDRHGEFTKTDIRNRLAHSYAAAKAAVAEDVSADTAVGDRIFFRLLNTICPEAEKQVQDAAIVLIAYFFEKCDVFEEPSS